MFGIGIVELIVIGLVIVGIAIAVAIAGQKRN